MNFQLSARGFVQRNAVRIFVWSARLKMCAWNVGLGDTWIRLPKNALPAQLDAVFVWTINNVLTFSKGVKRTLGIRRSRQMCQKGVVSNVKRIVWSVKLIIYQVVKSVQREMGVGICYIWRLTRIRMENVRFWLKAHFSHLNSMWKIQRFWKMSELEHLTLLYKTFN